MAQYLWIGCREFLIVRQAFEVIDRLFDRS